MLRKFLLGTAAGCIAAVLPVCALAQTPNDWLKRMADAVEQRNYEGTFVYMTPGKAETFKVYHRVHNGEVTERIIALDGAGAEIIRNPAELICIFPARRSVVVEARGEQDAKGNPLQARLPLTSGELSSLYDIQVIGHDRVLGRRVVVIAVDPRDAYRYGYRLWLDAVTAIPLKSQLVDEDSHMPLEEVRFTAIKLPDLLASSAVQTQLDTREFSWVHQSRQPSAAVDAADLPHRQWSAMELPNGFQLTMDKVEYTDTGAAPRIHQVYTDGLATVSVFIDAAVAASEQAEGLSMMGAANAYSVMRNGMLITAVGEVPPGTVEKFALSMRPDPAR